MGQEWSLLVGEGGSCGPVCAGRRTVMEEDVTDEFLVDLVRAAASASKDN